MYSGDQFLFFKLSFRHKYNGTLPILSTDMTEALYTALSQFSLECES